ncbi:MAG: hypothetical protein M1308_18585 [Actinobacteria bacterium]|nr:hypothetical protein [Actinomycetota bacterium]
MNDTEKAEISHKRQRTGYITSIVINGIFIFVLNNLLNWNADFINASYNKCLWAINISLGASIIANLIFIFYDPEWFKHLLEVFTSIAALVALYVIYAIFPFTFRDEIWENILSIFLIFAMVISGINIIYQIIRTTMPHKFKYP